MQSNPKTSLSPRWYPGWNILGVSLVFQAIIFGTTYFSFTFWVLPWSKEFDASTADVMVIIVLMQVVSGISAPLIGRAMDKAEIRLLVILGASLCALGLWLTGQATSLWHIGACYALLLSIATVLAGPLAAQTLAARWFNARRGLAIGLSSVGTSIGGIAIPALIGYWLVTEDWRTVHEYLAGLTIVTIVPLVWLFVKNSPQAANVTPEPESTNSIPMTSGNEWTTKELITNRSFVMLVLAVVPLVATTGAIQQNLAPYATDLQFDGPTIAMLVAIMSAAMILGKIFFGTMSDRLSHRLLMAIAVLLVYISLGLMLTGPSYTTMIFTVCVLGFGMGGFLPLLGAVVASSFGPTAFGRVMGLLGPFVTLAAVGPLIAGYLRDQSGSYDLAWLTFAGVLSISVLSILWMPKNSA